MPRSFSASSCWCWLVGAWRHLQVDPRVGARVLKAGGGCSRCGLAVFLGLRGEIGVAIPLGAFGLGVLGWIPFGAQAFRRAQKSTGQTRASVRHI